MIMGKSTEQNRLLRSPIPRTRR